MVLGMREPLFQLWAVVLLLVVSADHCRAVPMFDDQIKAATNKHLKGYDWRLYKAQLIAESGLNPNAKSPVGARGLAQFMPATWQEVAKALDFPPEASPEDPQYAIPAGAYYMKRQLKGWTAPRPEVDRLCLALASYNAGFGNILRAQRKADGANDYNKIIQALPQVTGHNADETKTYVRRILRIYSNLVTR